MSEMRRSPTMGGVYDLSTEATARNGSVKAKKSTLSWIGIESLLTSVILGTKLSWLGFIGTNNTTITFTRLLGGVAVESDTVTGGPNTFGGLFEGPFLLGGTDFDELRITETSGFGLVPMDNLRWNYAVSVPEPGTLALLGLGLAGMSGRSIGPHLHWEVTWKGRKLNPHQFLKLWGQICDPVSI